MLQGFPTQKLFLFAGITLIAFLSDGFFVFAYPISVLGRYLLLILFSWYLAGQLARHFINKNNVIGQLNKRSVLITGCDRGFGHLTALKLNELGFHVFAGCLNAGSDEAANLKKLCHKPDRMHLIQLNVTDEQQIESAFRQIEQIVSEQHLTFHALINNAGIGRNCPVEFGSYKINFGDTLDINLIAPIKLTRAALPLIRKSKQNHPNLFGNARIINICSQASNFHVSPIASYCVSKSGLLAFTNVLRQELSQFDVQAVSIEPTFFATNIISQETIKSNFDLVLDCTDSEVLQAYGPNFIKDKMQNVPSIIVSKRIGLVIDAIVEATQAYQPEFRYFVAEPIDQFILTCGTFLPAEMIFTVSKFVSVITKIMTTIYPSKKYDSKIAKYFENK